VRDANGQALACVYSRENEAEATGEGAHEGRRTAHRCQNRAAAGAAEEGRATRIAGIAQLAKLTDEGGGLQSNWESGMGGGIGGRVLPTSSRLRARFKGP
jgi:hypothetical protein